MDINISPIQTRALWWKFTDARARALIAESVMWVLFIPVGLSEVPGCLLGLGLTLSGLALIVFGLAAGVHFARGRIWYMRELGSTSVAEKRSIPKAVPLS